MKRNSITKLIITAAVLFSVIATSTKSNCADATVTGQWTSNGETYFCVGSVTAEVTPSSSPPDPTHPTTCCSSAGAPGGSWTLSDTRYQFMLNGQGVGNGIPNTNTVTLPAGTNTFNGEVQYEFTCEDGSLGYSTDPFSAISSKVAYVDDETTPTITPPNANPNYGLPDKTGDIYFTSTSDTLFNYDHYFSGTFTQIKGSDTFKVGSGQNSAGHTNCGQTGATLSFPGASSTVSLSVGMSGSRAGVGVSATAAVGVSVGSTGTSAGPIGENHKMVSWQIYDRETQITSMVKGANSYHKVINTTASITSNEGTINVATNLPTTKSVTGHAAATGALPCCPNTL